MDMKLFLLIALFVSVSLSQSDISAFDQIYWDRWAGVQGPEAQQPDTSPGQGTQLNSACLGLDDAQLADANLVQYTGNSVKYGNNYPAPSCWAINEAQSCFDELGNLDNEGYSKDENDQPVYGDLINSCNIRQYGDGQKVYDFLLSWIQNADPLDDYLHRDECVEQEINFISTQDGNSGLDRARFNIPAANIAYINSDENNENHGHNMWWYAPSTRQIYFSIDHEQLALGNNSLGCNYIESDTQYQWICDIELNVFFAGEIQFTYEFQMISTVDRTLTDSLTVAVNRNVVQGDCCENTLQVESSLHFCSNYECTTNFAGSPTLTDHLEGPQDAGWINGVKNVERRQIFWIAHRIDTMEFSEYFLEPVSVHIGSIVPKIHKWQQKSSIQTYNQNGTVNLTIYELESYVALDSLDIVTISLLEDQVFNFTPQARNRRILEDIGSDYKLKGQNMLSVSEPQVIDESQGDDDEPTQTSSLILSLGLSICVALISLV